VREEWRDALIRRITAVTLIPAAKIHALSMDHIERRSKEELLTLDILQAIKRPIELAFARVALENSSALPRPGTDGGTDFLIAI
jgi:hypothetical protein